jgi:hypothetical protein
VQLVVLRGDLINFQDLLLVDVRFEIWGIYPIVIIGFRLKAFKNLMPLLDHARIHLRDRSIRAAQWSLLLNQLGIRGQCVILSQPPAFFSAALILIRGLVLRLILGFYLEARLKVLIIEMLAIYGLLRSIDFGGKIQEVNFDPKVSYFLQARARYLPVFKRDEALDYGCLRVLRYQRML